MLPVDKTVKLELAPGYVFIYYIFTKREPEQKNGFVVLGTSTFTWVEGMGKKRKKKIGRKWEKRE